MVFLDNIIFSLQHSGGISVLWQNILKKLITGKEDFRCLEYSGCKNNIFRKGLDIPREQIDGRTQRYLPVERYLPVSIPDSGARCFHSSYYRYCTNDNVRNITTVHDFTYEYYSSGLAKQVHCWQKYNAIRHSDIIVCISENTKRDLLKFLPEVDESKIRVIYNGVSEEYHPLTTKLPDLSNYILFVGARGGYKNFDFVVEALQDTPYKLAICGRALLDEEQKRLDRTLGPNRYRLYKNISNEELNKLYNSVLCLAYPSSYEGFGIPILEAQRAGCPVIALNASSIPEVIGETPLLMQTLDKNQFIDRVNLLKNAEIRGAVVAAGLENSKRFSWGKMAEEYMAIYRDLLFEGKNL